MSKNKESFTFAVVMFLISLYFIMWYVRYGGENINSDGTVYYQNFVRVFITRDLVGGGLIKFPIGTTILQLPFLLIALLLSKILGISLDEGMAEPFQFATFFAALFYFVLTMTILYHFLRENSKSKSAIYTVICLTFGTMLPVYICEKSSFSHIYGFFMCTLFFTYIRYYEAERNLGRGLLMDFLLGVILGMCMIIRNTNIVVGAAYLFYEVTSFKSFGVRLKKVFSSRIIFQLIGAALVYAIQMIAWKLQTGNWIFYSYGNEEFTYKLKPQIMSVLFSDAKGLFIFCPVLFIGIVSMIAFYKQNKEYSLSQIIIFICVTYFMAAWWCWWLGGAYGERMYCDVLCIFAIPLAQFFEGVDDLSEELRVGAGGTLIRAVPVMLYAFTIVFVLLNVTWIRGTRNGAISDNLATWYELYKCFGEGFLR